ncbi:hypothetical protein C9374_002617 [Naegleria lovaniensis]|uniref:T4 RNA ligase 1-like N-terminal domain-containing protein n=1 Tax=Naegleria lovaniensis TaxID=51637 RepID=A0AA88KM76_NAELO|nr:uncharacterized protein C9374_002617 [Naegleria lovaniensis]KAG2386171.1 hypothetical protein C9374_002617 [Naegleria lovaniensis]
MFPIIKSYSDVKDCIVGRKEFVTQIDEGFRFIKYKSVVENTFSDLTDMNNLSDKERTMHLLRRECRGIVFDAENDKLVCRKFHKFFNINEKPESHVDRINWRRPFVVIEKMDGSLVAPIFTKKKAKDVSDIAFTTMLGLTAMAKNQVQGYIDKNLQHKGLRKPFLEFCKHCLDNGMSCLFEYTSPQNIIVIKYLEEKLTLLAIRHNETGQYLSYSKMKELLRKHPDWEKAVNLVSLWKDFPQGTDEPHKLLSEIYEQKGVEGYVIRFEDGDFYKVKTKYYMCFHGISGGGGSESSAPSSGSGAMSAFSAEKIRERHLIKAIMNDVIDDVISGVYWTAEMRQSVSKFRIEIAARILDKFEGEVWPILLKAIQLSQKGLANTPTGDFVKDMLSKLSSTSTAASSATKSSDQQESDEENDNFSHNPNRGNFWSVLQEEEVEDAEQDAIHDPVSDAEDEDEEKREQMLLPSQSLSQPLPVQTFNNVSQTLSKESSSEEHVSQSAATSSSTSQPLFDTSNMKFAPIHPGSSSDLSAEQQLENQKQVAFECFKIFLQNKTFQVNDPSAFESKKVKNYAWLGADLSVMGQYSFDGKSGCLVKNSTRKVLSKKDDSDDYDFSKPSKKGSKKKKK